MAASKSYFPRANYRFLPTDQSLSNNAMIFDLDESEVWHSAARSQSPEFRKQRKPPPPAVRNGAAASLPVNIPDWSKILKDEYKENRRSSVDEDYEEEEENGGEWIPPHEFLARGRIASFSMQEGTGRTLKGRDLNKVRNAIWQKIGFQD